MSGHTDFTWWINTEAKHVIYKGEPKKIKGTFFTSDGGCHNSDIFMIRLAKKSINLGDNDLDYNDLSERFDEYKNKKNKPKNKKKKKK